MKLKVVKNLLFLAVCLLSGSLAAEDETKVAYENYSFDFSAHTRPIAYSTAGNALELLNKVKVNPAVADRAGAYIFDVKLSDKDFVVDVEFTIQSQLSSARGFMILLTQQEMLENEFIESTIGYH